jgi:hypothetical protein
MSEVTPTMPVIHMNGTSPDTLLEDNCNIARAINAAMDAIQKAEFNGRDYYTVPGSFEKALAERKVHLTALKAAEQYFFAIAEHCSDAVAEREKRKSGK